MVLRRWDPFRELERMDETLRRDITPGGIGVGPEAWVVPVDVVQDPERIVVQASVPGTKPEDLNVTFEDGVLTIEGRNEEGFEQGNYLLRERGAGTFRRSLQVPDAVDIERAETTYEHGVLTVSLPKSEEKKARRLEVRARDGDKVLTE